MTCASCGRTIADKVARCPFCNAANPAAPPPPTPPPPAELSDEAKLMMLELQFKQEARQRAGAGKSNKRGAGTLVMMALTSFASGMLTVTSGQSGGLWGVLEGFALLGLAVGALNRVVLCLWAGAAIYALDVLYLLATGARGGLGTAGDILGRLVLAAAAARYALKAGDE